MLIYDIIPPEKIKKITKEILGLKEYKSNAHKAFGIGWRLGVLLFLIFFITAGFAPIRFSWGFLTGSLGGGENMKTVNFYPTVSYSDVGKIFCLEENFCSDTEKYFSEKDQEFYKEGWQNIDRVLGTPEVDSMADISYFSEENSAIYRVGLYSLTVEQFIREAEEELISEEGEEIGENAESAENIEDVEIEDIIGEETGDADNGETEKDEAGGKNEADKADEIDEEINKEDGMVGETEEDKETDKENEINETGEVEEVNGEIEVTNDEISETEGSSDEENEQEIDKENEIDEDEDDTGDTDEIDDIEDINEKDEDKDGEEEINLLGKIKNFLSSAVVAQEKIFSAKINLSLAIKESAEKDENIEPLESEEIIIIKWSLNGKDWYILDTLYDYPLSSTSNSPTSSEQVSGRFEYEAPFLKSFESVENLRIKFEGMLEAESGNIVYLDSVWIEVEYQEEEIPEELILETPKKDWRADEIPEFTVKKIGGKEQTGLMADISSVFERKPELKEVVLTSSGGKLRQLEKGREILVEQSSPINIKLTDTENLKPGKHTFKAEVEWKGNIHILEQDFTWGVLAINFNKSIYTTGDEQSFIQMGVLDDRGNTICDADLELRIKNQELGIDDYLSTDDRTIQYSGECAGNSYVEIPDYFAYYNLPGRAGIYELELTAHTKNGIRTVTDSFEVRESVPFDVERTGPTRIYPPADYEMRIIVKANQDFRGEIIETVPESFELKTQSAKLKTTAQNSKLIIWEADLKQGDILELTYAFNAPNVSPYIYMLGPLRLRGPEGEPSVPYGADQQQEASDQGQETSDQGSYLWSEAGQWQIATDQTEQMILFWEDTGSIPSGWSCISCDSQDDFFETFILASSTYGISGGSAEHTHSATGTTSSAQSTTQNIRVGTTNVAGEHTHQAAETAVQNAANLPEYRQIRVIIYDSTGTPDELPTGTVAMFATTSLPSGWTLQTTHDNRFLRGGNDATSEGGSNSHNHTISATSSGPSATIGGGTRDTAVPTDSHIHSGSGTSDTADNIPPFRKIVLAKKDAAGPIPTGMYAFWNAAPDSDWTVCSSSTDDFANRFILPDSTLTASLTGGSIAHNHSQQTITLLASVDTIAMDSRPGQTQVTAAGTDHTHTTDITYTEAEHMPPYMTAILAEYTYTEQVPGPPGTPTYANVSTSTLTVNWTAPTEGGALDYYKIERAPDSDGSPGAWSQIATTTGLFYNDAGLETDTTYWYRIRATNETGDGEYSSHSSVTTDSVLIDKIIISGFIFENDEATTSSQGSVIHLAIDGLSIATTTASTTDGSYVFESVSQSATSTPTTVFIDDTEESGAVITRYQGHGNIENLNIYVNRVIVRHEDSGPITNTNIGHYTTDTPYTATTSAFSLSADHKLLIWQGKTFTPGGTVTTPISASSTHPGGDLEIQTGAVLNMEDNNLSVGGNYLNNGTFSKTIGQKITFTATSQGHTINNSASTFEDIIFDGLGGGWQFSTTTILDGNLQIADGTLSGTNDITIKGGYLDCGLICGTINLSAGTAFLEGTGDLGTFGLAADWTFNNLTLGDNSTVATTTARFAASSSFIVLGNLNIQIAHIFEAPQSGVDFTIGGNYTNNGSFIHNNGRMEFNGASQQTISGNLTASSSFNILTFSNNSGADDPFEPGIILTSTTTVSTSTIVTPSVRVQFQANSTFYFNKINWNGQSVDTRIFLRSSSPGEHWFLHINSNPVYNLNVQDSDASSSPSSVDATDPSNFDAGNNENWDFGDVYFPQSQNWQWYMDEQNETPQYPLADENQTPSYLLSDKTVKLRLTIREMAGVGGEDIKMRIQYSTSSDFSENTHFLPEIGDCTSTDAWCYGDGIDEDNDPITTLILSDATTTATHNESGISTSTYFHASSTAAEWEFTIKNNSAEEGVVYYFRAYDNTNSWPVVFRESYSYPSILPGTAELSFTVEGLPSGTSTRGVTTNISTTPGSVSFGNLPFGQSRIGAHRFNVSTNAPQGYQVFVFERNQLMSATEDIIVPVSGTNETPSAWSVDDVSAYGYHAGDDSLSDVGDGPSRFAAVDSYARFETDPKEIGYHPFPTAEQIFDFIFRVEVTEMQPAGNHISEIVYIAIPTF